MEVPTGITPEGRYGEVLCVYGNGIAAGEGALKLLYTNKNLYPSNVLSFEKGTRELSAGPSAPCHDTANKALDDWKHDKYDWDDFPLVEPDTLDDGLDGAGAAGGKMGESPAPALAYAYYENYKKKDPNCYIFAVNGANHSQTIYDSYSRSRILKVGSMSYGGSKHLERIGLNCRVALGFFACDESLWYNTGHAYNHLKYYLRAIPNSVGGVDPGPSVFADEDTATPDSLISVQSSFQSAKNNYNQNAMTMLHREGLTKMVTPTYFMPYQGNHRRPDSRGSQIIGAYWARAAHWVNCGKEPPVLWAEESKRIDKSSFSIIFDVPVPPLKLVETKAQHFGFSSENVQITKVELGNDGKSVVITTNGLPDEMFKVSYGFGPSAQLFGTIAGGGVCDSDPTVVTVGVGDPVPLINYSFHFEIGV